MGAHSVVLALCLFATAGEEPPLPEGDDPAPADKPSALAIVVSGLEKDASLGFRFGRAATERLAKKMGADAVDLEAAIAPEASELRKREIDAALLGVEKGTRAFEDLDLDTAGTVLEGAVNTLLAYLDDLSGEQRATLEAAIFEYGATTLFEGDTDLAESIFVALLLLDPKYSPSKDQYPSNVISRFESLRPKLVLRPTGGIKVNTTPEGADVYLDGTFKGASPLEIGGLTDGQHVIVAKRIGFKPFGTLTPVTADQKASIDIDLEPGPTQEALGGLRPSLAGDPSAAIALGRKLGVRFLAVLALEKKPGGGSVKFHGVFADAVKGSALGRVEALETVLDPDVGADALVAALFKGETPEVAKAAEDAPITEKWWFWVLMGGALVAAAGVTAWGISAQGERHPPPNGIVLGF